MTPAEIEAKIQELLDSKEAENTYIGLCLMMSQLELSMEEALRRLKPDYQDKGDENFKAFYKIGHLQLEYEYEKGYVPYMGTGATVSRMLGIWEKASLEYQLDYAAFLNLEDNDGAKEAKNLVEEDFQELIPYIEDLLKL
jgi:hypothetical protein